MIWIPEFLKKEHATFKNSKLSYFLHFDCIFGKDDMIGLSPYFLPPNN